MGAGVVGPETGSRWSARSEARTYDLDAGEDRRIIEHFELLQWLSHRVPLQVGGECRWVRAIRPCLGARALGLGDMTIDRVTQRGARPRRSIAAVQRLLASSATSGAGRAGPLPSADLPGHVSDISGRLC